MTEECEEVKATLDLLEQERMLVRVLEEELEELRPLARLAHLIAFLEGDCTRAHKARRGLEKELEDIRLERLKLLNEIIALRGDALNQDREAS